MRNNENKHICPFCGNTYEEEPSISSLGKGQICPHCGLTEDLETYMNCVGTGNPEYPTNEDKEEN